MLTLAIIGRPNVGKSTLFNRLAGKKLAIINDAPGITRDWREAEGFLFDEPLRLIDTAGLEEEFDDSIRGRMRKQTEAALAQADAALFLIDGRAGLTPLDEHFASWLRKQKLPVILGINKCESEKAAAATIGEAYGLGLGDPVIMSAEHGVGMDDLYDALAPYIRKAAQDSEDSEQDEDAITAEDRLPSDIDELEGREDYDFATAHPEDAQEEEKALKLAIVGRPNAGKSTLLNSLVGHERVMTGPEAGITRDAIAVQWVYKDKRMRLVDTAGMRRKARITDAVEKMAVDDALRAIRLAQVVVLMLDAELGLEKQDLTIAQHIIEEGRALVIAVNKWDAIRNKREVLQQIEDRMTRSLAQVKQIPVVTISALGGRNLETLMDKVLETYNVWNRRVRTGDLNRWLAMMESRNPAPMVDGRPNRLKYITQIKARPPTFVMWTSRPGDLPESYKRYIVNGLREDYDIRGVPIRLLVRTSKNPYS